MRKFTCLLFVLALSLATGCDTPPQNELIDEAPVNLEAATDQPMPEQGEEISSETEDTPMNLETETDQPTVEQIEGIIKTYKQTIPATRFIGKNYGSGKHPNWGDAFGSDVFGQIETAAGGADKIHALYEDADAYVGMYYRNAETGGHDGWVGMFAPIDTDVPEGLEYIDFPEQSLGVCWIYGKQSEVYNKVSQCPAELASAGMAIQSDENGYIGFFERDQCPRFTSPDEKGNIILDYCYFVD